MICRLAKRGLSTLTYLSEAQSEELDTFAFRERCLIRQHQQNGTSGPCKVVREDQSCVELDRSSVTAGRSPGVQSLSPWQSVVKAKHVKLCFANASPVNRLQTTRHSQSQGLSMCNSLQSNASGRRSRKHHLFIEYLERGPRLDMASWIFTTRKGAQPGARCTWLLKGTSKSLNHARLAQCMQSGAGPSRGDALGKANYVESGRSQTVVSGRR